MTGGGAPVSQGAGQLGSTGRRLVAHSERCTGCLTCQLACSLQHEGFCSPSWARLHVMEAAREQGFELAVCLQCEDAPCAAACVNGAFVAADGLWTIDRDACTGCGLCQDACTEGVLTMDPEDGLAMRCDLCGGSPRCAAYCETGALEWAAAAPGGTAASEDATGEG